jgi:hypothetical protein
MNKYIAEFIGTFFLVLTGRVHRNRQWCRGVRPVSDRLGAHGNDFCWGAYFRRALQSSRYVGRMATREVRGQRCSAVHDFSDFRSCACGLRRQVFEGRRCCYTAPAGDSSGTSCGVSLHFCAGLRGTEHCHGQRYIRQLLLWAGHWVHGASGGVFRWQHFRWSVQSSGGSGHLLYATVPLAEYLDLPCG